MISGLYPLRRAASKWIMQKCRSCNIVCYRDEERQKLEAETVISSRRRPYQRQAPKLAVLDYHSSNWSIDRLNYMVSLMSFSPYT